MNFQMTTAFVATSVFHKGAGEYGLLGSIMAIGSLAGALLVRPAGEAAAALRRRLGVRLRGVRDRRQPDADLPAVRDLADPGRAVR